MANMPYLSHDELKVIKSALLDFVTRVSANDKSKMPEEVQILPTITDLLLRFRDLTYL